MADTDKTSGNRLIDLISENRQNPSKDLAGWSGTLLEFMRKLRNDSEARRLHVGPHARIHDAIVSSGVRGVLDGNDAERMRKFFEGNHQKVFGIFKDFFGIEEPLAQIAQFFAGGSRRGEERRQFLCLWGPPGCGKSSIFNRLRHALETHLGGPLFSLEGSTMPQDPLWLVPKHLRASVSENIGVYIDPEADVDPKISHRLMEEFNGEYERFPVVTKRYSMRDSFGIAVTPPVDPNNQDIGVLIGEIDVSKMDRLPPDDPDLLLLTGAYNVGNRGMIEFVEIWKSGPDYHHTLMTATTDRYVKAPGNFPVISIDVVIVAASNEPEFRKFLADPETEGLRSRMTPVRVPYNIRLTEEVLTYKKMIGTSEFMSTPMVPHTLEVLAMFAVMTRLKPSDRLKSLLSKMKIYDGQDLLGDEANVSYEDLKAEAGSQEGMHGIDPRFTIKAFDQACDRRVFADPVTIREVLIDMINGAEECTEDEKEHYKNILTGIVHKEYLELLEHDMSTAAIHGYSEQAEALFNRYLDHAEAYANKETVRDRTTGERMEPDIKFLASIESAVGITGNACDGFRDDVQRYTARTLRKGGTLSYKSYPPLRDAIEKHLVSSIKPLLRVITKATTRDEEQEKKYTAMVNELINIGYPEESIEFMVTYAANNLFK